MSIGFEAPYLVKDSAQHTSLVLNCDRKSLSLALGLGPPAAKSQQRFVLG